MGCERVQEPGNLGFGGVRASMERRWLINAKTTIMRQRKWQEVRMQKELDEKRKKAEILEKRKQERARLSAYIHSATQPLVKCATNEKGQYNNHKKLNWNTSLLHDQELILKLRENVKAIAYNHHFKKSSSTSSPAMQGQSTCKTTTGDLGGTSPKFGAQGLCLKRDSSDPIRLFQIPLMEKNSQIAYQLLQLPETIPTRCDIAVNTSTTWPLNTMASKSEFVDDHQSPQILENNNMKNFNANIFCQKNKRSQSNNDLLSNLEDTEEDIGPQISTKVVGCCDELIKRDEISTALDKVSSQIQESTTRWSSPNLKEEILKSRLVNAVATTQLIAEVTAIESRLEDCNMNLKSLCIKENQNELLPVVWPTANLFVNAHDVHCDNDIKKNIESSLDSRKENLTRVSSMIGIEIDDKYISNLEVKQSTQHTCETKASLLSPSDKVSENIFLENTLFSSSPLCRQVESTHIGQGNIGMEEFGLHKESKDDRGTTCSQVKKLPNLRLDKKIEINPKLCIDDLNERKQLFVISNFLHEVDNTNREDRYPQGDTKARDSLIFSPRIVDNAHGIEEVRATCDDSAKESNAAWKIDWDAATNQVSERNQQDLQTEQFRHYSHMSHVADINIGGKKCSNISQLSHQMYEPKKQKVHYVLKSGCTQPESIHKQGGQDCSTQKLEGATCPSNISCETSGFDHVTSNLESGHCFQDQYIHQDTVNQSQGTGLGTPMQLEDKNKYKDVDSYITYFPKDKENDYKFQRQSLIEEEQKIFASLERLDWKLAAISLRSMNVGRESTISQGQYSTKSAPTIMRSPPSTIMEHFSAKNAIPYSTIPSHPRPLTPQGAPSRRIPTGRQRRQVGLTNKAGKMHNLNRTKSVA